MKPTPTRKTAVDSAMRVRVLRVNEAVIWDEVAGGANVATAAARRVVVVAAVYEGAESSGNEA